MPGLEKAHQRTVDAVRENPNRDIPIREWQSLDAGSAIDDLKTKKGRDLHGRALSFRSDTRKLDVSADQINGCGLVRADRDAFFVGGAGLGVLKANQVASWGYQ